MKFKVIRKFFSVIAASCAFLPMVTTAGPGEAKTCEAKTCEAKSCEAKTCEAKTGESKTCEAKACEAKTCEAKACEAKTGESKTCEASWRGQSITEFPEDKSERLEWQVVNDGVMGGLSEGNVEFTDAGTIRFYGDLSLKNNGGFSTIRSGDLDLNLSNDLGVLLLVKGDGRTYEARLDSTAEYRGMPVSFVGEFKTTKGEWQQVRIPFSAFKGSFRGTELPDAKLDTSAIKRVWILLGDKKEAPFELEVDWIRTFGKGQGDFKGSQKSEKLSKGKEKSGAPQKLIATAVNDGRFKTLKAALDAAGLTPFFEWDNPLTVFAPTDEAFAKLPKKVLQNLLKPENKDQLVAILSYHVTVGSSELADALAAKKLKTIEGASIQATFKDGRVRINDAALVNADIKCADGIIHVIDTVLMPPKPERKTVLSTAKKAGSFSTLLAAIDAAGLSKVLGGDGPFTVFAPTDDAFGSLPEGTVESLLKKENKDKLIEILKYHVVSGRVSAGDALNSGSAKTLQGNLLKFRVSKGLLKAGDSTIESVGIDGGNGIIHVIDAVLLPAST